MAIQIKEYKATLDADSGELAEGQFKALVSVFGNVDSYGDVVAPGAFTKTLQEWAESGDPIPVVWSHNWGDPFSHIGVVLNAIETGDGLEVTGQLDLENPTAEQVSRLLKSRRIRQFSFAYDVIDAATVERDGEDVNELRELKLYEVGPCLVGVNQETELLAAKATRIAAGAKEGRVLAQRHIDTLRGAYDALGTVLEAAERAPEKTSGPTGPDEQTDIEPVEPHQDEEAAAPKSTSAAMARAIAVATILKG